MALTSRELKVYNQAKAADTAFQRELVRVYKGRAGDLRYQPHRWTDTRVKHAGARALRATDRWMKVFRAANERSQSISMMQPQANPHRRKGTYPRGKVPPHLKKYLFKKGHR